VPLLSVRVILRRFAFITKKGLKPKKEYLEIPFTGKALSRKNTFVWETNRQNASKGGHTPSNSLIKILPAILVFEPICV
jgi:hypothetical protein